MVISVVEASEQQQRLDLAVRTGLPSPEETKGLFAAYWIHFLSKSFEMGMPLCHAVFQQVTRPLAGRTSPLIPTPRSLLRVDRLRALHRRP